MASDFNAHQRSMARRLGYGADVDGMNHDHDPLHRALCAWLGVESFALREAAGESLAPAAKRLAIAEERAVLALQRFARIAGARPPRLETD